MKKIVLLFGLLLVLGACKNQNENAQPGGAPAPSPAATTAPAAP